MGRPAKDQTIKPAKKQEIKSDDTIVEVLTPFLSDVVIKVSKKRNIVVDKQADNKNIKETWLGTEMEFTFKLPKNTTLEEQYKFVDEQIPIAKKKADDYFVNPQNTTN